MRYISTSTFWQNVRLVYGEQRYKELEVVFYPPAPPRDERGWRDMMEQRIPPSIEAARINGCKKEASLREYFYASLQLIQDALGRNLDWMFGRVDLPEPVIKEMHAQTAALSRKYARQRACHPIRRGYVCYCEDICTH